MKKERQQKIDEVKIQRSKMIEEMEILTNSFIQKYIKPTCPLYEESYKEHGLIKSESYYETPYGELYVKYNYLRRRPNTINNYEKFAKLASFYDKDIAKEIETLGKRIDENHDRVCKMIEEMKREEVIEILSEVQPPKEVWIDGITVYYTSKPIMQEWRAKLRKIGTLPIIYKFVK